MVKGINGLSRSAIIAKFPHLGSDVHFAITSDASRRYNCIAWAYQVIDQWIWPGGRYVAGTDDACLWWPLGIDENEDISAFIKVFEQKEYNICETWEHEDGFQKIALYVHSGTTICSHASREIIGSMPISGCWTSKLGIWNDICHSSPYFLEGILYGEIYCIMKRISNL